MSTNSLPPVARKLVQKLSTLQPRTTSLESRDAIASWIIFNRKKCDGIGEGMVSYITGCSSSGGDYDAAVRLMLLLRILHRVLLSNRPGGDDGDGDTWSKSLAMRTRLGEIVISPIWTALAASFVGIDDDAITAMRDEIRTIIDEWKEYDVFCGPTVWEEYKKGWARALKDVATAKTITTSADKTDGGDMEEVKTTSDVNAMSVKDAVVPTMMTESNENDLTDSVNDSISEKPDERGDQPNLGDLAISSPDKAVMAPIRQLERQATVDLEIDFGDVEAANVEPSQFLEACRVIASIQITRDLGSDAAMNVSSALSGIPQEVEEACNVILTQQRKNGDAAEEKVPVEKLSQISDEVLDVDIKYARQSLQSYREAIRQQRIARLHCLNLLLQSRCSFGSIEAASAFYGGNDAAGDVNMIAILEKLKKRKEILVDAMALEGLDVEEDEEEKKLAKDEEELTPFSWFPGPDLVQVVDDKIVGEEPAGKRVKTS